MSHLHHPTLSTPSAQGPPRRGLGQVVRRDPPGRMEPECSRWRAGAGRTSPPGLGMLPMDTCHHLLLLGTPFATSLPSAPANRHGDGVCTGDSRWWMARAWTITSICAPAHSHRTPHLSGTGARAAAGPSCWGSGWCSWTRSRTVPLRCSESQTAGWRRAAPPGCCPSSGSSGCSQSLWEGGRGSAGRPGSAASCSPGGRRPRRSPAQGTQVPAQVQSAVHRIRAWWGFEGASGDHPVQPPCRSRVTPSRLHRTASRRGWISPENETPQPLWAAWSRTLKEFQGSRSFCFLSLQDREKIWRLWNRCNPFFRTVILHCKALNWLHIFCTCLLQSFRRVCGTDAKTHVRKELETYSLSYWYYYRWMILF